MTDTGELSYFDRRMQEIGINDENNVILIWQTDINHPDYGKSSYNGSLKPFPIFSKGERGIDIMPYSIDRCLIRYSSEGSRHKNHIYKITRLETPVIKRDGSSQKYHMPKGQPVLPFFPPGLVKKYEEKQPIRALYITEGYFKAMKADLCGIDCIGLPSITCMKDRDTNKLHSDILKLIEVCRPERVVWLTDGDCRDITAKEITDGIDLYKRPKNFFNTVSTFSELMSGYPDVQKYFAHINTSQLAGHPKGLDDMLIALPGDTDAIRAELEDFSTINKEGVNIGRYITRVNITFNLIRINHYFMLHDVNVFYLYHSEARRELKNAKNFLFNGTLYRYDEKEGKCAVEVPKTAADYIRVGDGYYQHITVPDKNATLRRTLASRKKETIIDDNGKGIFKHIQKYNSFCVVPDHVNYQQVSHNCWNLYNPFIHDPEEGECPHTLAYIRHVFGTEPVPYNDTDGKAISIPRYELGLDYITLLYQRPQQILPILCLVSNERQTGKTTFVNWLDTLFAENVISIGNEDMQADFNAHWVSKLVIACDETKLDKHEVIQKVKRLSTADKIVMNAKGKDQITLPFFAKFILMSNDEEDFIRIDKHEIRFWVIKVPKLETVNTDLMKLMIEEIPAFLHYITKRQMVTTQKERHWFDTQLLQTEALRKVKENSVSSVERRIILEITNLFELVDVHQLAHTEWGQEIKLPLDYIADLCGQKDKNYVKKSLHRLNYKSSETVSRYFYPVKEIGWEGELKKIVLKPVNTIGRYYLFKREDFTTATNETIVTAEAAQCFQSPEEPPF